MTTLTIAEAVPLGYAYAMRVADAAGIRALAIKGPVTERHTLRAPRDSVDVDVLVDPARFDEYVDALTDLGWSVMPHTAASVLPHHSRTATRADWQVEVDVHHWIPGLMVGDAEAFEILWGRGEQMMIAGTSCLSTDLLSSAAVEGLQQLRDGRPAAELDHLARRLRTQLSEAQRDELAELARTLGASETLAPLLEQLGAAGDPGVAAPAVPQQALRDWQLATHSQSQQSVHLLAQLRRTRLRRWPALVARSVWLTDEEIAWRYPDATGGRQLLVARACRLVAGLRALPGAARVLARREVGE